MSLDIYKKILELKSTGAECVLMTVVEKEGSTPAMPGIKMLVCPDGRTFGTIGGGSLEQMAISEAQNLFNERKSRLKKYLLSDTGSVLDGEQTGMICGGSVLVFFEYISPGKSVYIFGVGHCGKALVRHLQGLSYNITIVDNRPGAIDEVEGANNSFCMDYEKFLSEHKFAKSAYFVIMTHKHQFDYDILKRIYELDLSPKYVGVISSRKKATIVLEKLKEDCPDADLSILYMPIGLDIGGDSPDEIAISIIAEMQAITYSSGGCKHMRLDYNSCG